jgi:hypothetical protein
MNKSTRTLLVIFALLAVIYFLFFRTKERVSSDSKIDAKLFVADSTKIDKIEMVRKTDAVTLEKINGVWQITKPINYAADTTSVYQMLKDLKNFRIEDEASTNPAKFGEYLDTSYNAQITVHQEGKLLGTFILGKTSSSFDVSFIKPDEERILRASSIATANFNKPLKDFRNKFIVSITTPLANKITFKSTDSNNVDFTTVKDSIGRWSIDGDSVSTSVMDGFLNMFQNWNTEDFKDTTITVFPTPTYTLTFYGPFSPITINLYHEAGSSPNAFMVQVTGIQQIFRIFDGIASQVMKKEKDFVPEPPK